MRRVALLSVCLWPWRCGAATRGFVGAGRGERQTVQPAKRDAPRRGERGDRSCRRSGGLGEALRRSGRVRRGPRARRPARRAGCCAATYKRLNGERDSPGATAAASCSSSTRRRSAATRRSSRASRRCTARAARDGLVVLGFPANDFAGQEPRSDEEIATFCEANYGVSFPMFAKTTRHRRRRQPAVPRAAAAAGAPEWNFNKYLVDRARAGRRALRRRHRARRRGARRPHRQAAGLA